MSWSDLQLYAVPVPFGVHGVSAHSPTVWDTKKQCAFVVRILNAEVPIPNLCLSLEEVEYGIKNGSLLHTPKLPAKQNFLVVLRSTHFKQACITTSYQDEISWARLDALFDFAYISQPTKKVWAETVGEALLSWAEEQLVRPRSELGKVQDVLTEARFVSRNALRLRFFLGLDLLLEKQKNNSSQSAIRADGCLEFGFTRQEFHARAEQYRASIGYKRKALK